MIVILENLSHQNLDTFPMATKINFDLDIDLSVEIGVPKWNNMIIESLSVKHEKILIF